MTMKTIKRDYRYLADRERRWPHGSGILLALAISATFWIAVYYLTLEG